MSCKNNTVGILTEIGIFACEAGIENDPKKCPYNLEKTLINKIDGFNTEKIKEICLKNTTPILDELIKINSITVKKGFNNATKEVFIKFNYKNYEINLK